MAGTTFAATPPIAMLWHVANRVPASTDPRLDCHVVANVPAAGPMGVNPTSPRTGDTVIYVTIIAAPVAHWRPLSFR
ncbi:hypothetical protein I7I50_01457 [Histoplasma capsulatum G186AR]|uniref:Uncharacterized protein n=1 Tax=Ajellomyces capsulatus TaxID=5037 RepID=A0A8H7YD81_AJECA|nr:hypothetical protein I7I52_12573 [Histoplasma capsulatum]QSS73331.1 hypothetical protein I7I50_01457 [Histoplasma capsulatum G186AR]